MGKNIKNLAIIIIVLTMLFSVILAGCEKSKPGDKPGKPGSSGKPGKVITKEPPGIPNLTEVKSDKPLPPYEVKVLGNSVFSEGAKGAVRIITYNPSTQNPVPDIPVSIYLKKLNVKKLKDPDPDEYRKRLVFSQKTGKNGSLDARFDLLGNKEGEYTMEVVTGVIGNHTKVESLVKIEKKFRIYLSIDKPRYQPGQKINIRALVLELPSLQPVAEKEIVLEVQDAKGNKVYKQEGKTSKYGISSGVFQLADEVNMGTFKVKAVLGEKEAARDVEVKKYVLPKFKISFKTDRKFYAPGDTVKGNVQVNYFFGKPVSKGKVKAILHTFDAAMRNIAVSKGATDKAGHFKFEMKIPTDISGSPLDKGKKKALMEVVVTDTADHKERTYKSLPISNESLKVELIPESGKLKGGIENKIFVLTSFPDGSPVAATVNIKVGQYKRSVVTDKAGLGEFLFTPEKTSPLATAPGAVLPDRRSTSLVEPVMSKRRPTESEMIRRPDIPRRRIPRRPSGMPFHIDAYTPKGDKLKTTLYLPTAKTRDNILIRPAKAAYKVGDTIKFDILSTMGQGTCYVDFVRDNRLISTHAVTLSGSTHPFSLEAAPDMVGMVTVSAYYLNQQNTFIRDTRNIFVQSADDLKIETSLDKPQYKPGEDAKISFSITDKSGSPVAAAMGINIVDEALFAMGQMRPGLEKAYFLLQKEFMTPKYEIRGRMIRDIALDSNRISTDMQTLDEILLAKAPADVKYDIDLDSNKKKIKECYDKMRAINASLSMYFSKNRSYPGINDMDKLERDYLNNDKFKRRHLRHLALDKLVNPMTDPWGTRFYFKTPRGMGEMPVVMTCGPDKKKGTNDDKDFSQIQQEYWKLFPQLRPVPRYFMEKRSMPSQSENYVKVKRITRKKIDSVETKIVGKESDKAGVDVSDGEPPVKIREYFPETLYTNPQVITDEKGKAEIEVKMADSITSWRMAAFANSLKGKMGNIVSAIKVFQDFFIDIDFPVALTQGDEIAVPVALYNYLKEEQKVTLTVDTSDKWFELLDKNEKTVTMKPDEVKAVYFKIKAKNIGNHTFTVHGKGSKLSDAIRREIEVLPNGRMFMWTKSDVVSKNQAVTVPIPQNALPGASKILVRLYPGVMSQVVEGLEKVFRMPYGCFEQTTATTYPNVMVLDYLKKQKKIQPKLQMMAEKYINTGYQRLLSFEVQGGGFSYYGKAPANPALTAMGIMEFRDMSKVHPVDEKVIERAQRWLASQQKADGSWNGNMRFTAYIVWALSESGYDGPSLKKGMKYLRSKIGQVSDPYILALTGGAMANKDPDGKLTREILDKLKKLVHQNEKSVYWGTKRRTVTRSYGRTANIEVTSLAAIAFMKSNGYEDVATKAVTYLVQSKDPHGTWYSTQSTVLAMKALILAHERSTKDVDAKVKITVNGKQTEEFRINSQNYDVFNQADFGNVTVNGDNKVEITLTGKGSCYYQVSAKYYMPWVKEKPVKKSLSINIDYDRTKLEANEYITATVYVRNNSRETMHNVMIDLGIPPGFTVDTGDLNSYVNNVFAKYSITSRQILIYTDTVEAGKTLKFKYKLHNRFPMKGKTPRSKAYLYYEPAVEAVAEPVTLEVKM